MYRRHYLTDQPSQNPLASQALLDYLDSLYPDRAPTPFISLEEVWFNAGRVAVIRKLKADVKAHNTQDNDEEE
jgi:hypothetical protein